jgi:hypothetical protein
MTDHDHDHKRDPSRDDQHGVITPASVGGAPEEQQGANTPVPVSGGGAVSSLTTLQAMFNSVDTSSVISRSGLPLMSYKSRENAYSFGQQKIIPEADSRWAVNVATFQWGYVCFDGTANKPPIGEKLVSVCQPKPDPTKLPAMGHSWQEEWGVNLRCINGVDEGVEVTFRGSTNGIIQAIAKLVEEVRERLNACRHDGKIVPIVNLKQESYPHKEHGRIAFPVLEIVDWMSLDGPAPKPPAPKPAPAPKRSPTAGGSSATEEQPRRRRVA